MTYPIVITGASGWFGRTALSTYEYLYGPEAIRRNIKAYASSQKSIDFGSPHGPIIAEPLEAVVDLPQPFAILHLAFLTRDKVSSTGFDKYVSTNKWITSQIIHLITKYPNTPLISISSGAASVYDHSQLDLENDPYGTLKKTEENLILSHSISRLTVLLRVYGATGRFIVAPHRFAIGSFLLQAISNGPVTIESKIPVWRSYIDVACLMTYSFSLMHDRTRTDKLKINACTDIVSLLDLARMITSEFNLPSPIHSFESAKSSDIYTADPAPFLAELFRYNITPTLIQDQITTTYKGVSEFPNNKCA